jgi:4-amino-4-deoxy-L-arabinose transferase-like glycosyltransferase
LKMKSEPNLDGTRPSASRRFFRSLPVIVVAAFLVRLAFYMPLVQASYRGAVVNFQFGAETGAVAAAIAQGRGFSSPLRMVQTGPTGWFAPIYPYLLAGIFKLFGVYSYQSNLIISLIDIALSALTCWPLATIGTRSFNKATGIAAAWAWAFLPTSIFFSVAWVWDTSLAALWLTMLVAATLQLRGSDRVKSWLGYGALWSAGAMINPSLLSVLPPLALWAIWPLRRRIFPALKLATLATVVFTAGLVPWTIRNYVVFHKLIALRSNFGLELWLGNNPGVPDSWTPWLHPNDNIDEARKYARMTEIPYMEEKSREAWAFMRSHPVDTLRFSLHRFANNWLGIWDSPADIWAASPWYLRLLIVFSCAFALLSWIGMLLAYRSKSKAAPALAIVMLIFPLAFYLTHTSLRYRLPMDPVMLILTVFAVQYVLSPSVRALQDSDVNTPDTIHSQNVTAEVPEAVLT